jgi:non-SMC mitotic condensation complex subunit 1
LTKNAANKLEEIFIPLKNATNDKTSEVRKATFQMIARLLNGFAPLVLKTYEGQLVLTLLNGLNDENEEVQALCSGLLESVGENIKRLENKVQEEK